LWKKDHNSNLLKICIESVLRMERDGEKVSANNLAASANDLEIRLVMKKLVYFVKNWSFCLNLWPEKGYF